MNYFELLPDEIIIEICNNLDKISLDKFIKTSKTNHEMYIQYHLNKKVIEFNIGVFGKLRKPDEYFLVKKYGDYIGVSCSKRLSEGDILIPSLNLTGSKALIMLYLKIANRYTPIEIQKLLCSSQ